SGCGAGIVNRGDLTLIDSVVSGNTGEGSFFFGGGLDHSGGEGTSGFLHILRCIIAANHSEGRAGGLYLGGGEITITDSTVAGNVAGAGGGIYFASGVLQLLGSTIASNGCVGVGGGLAMTGGALTATNCTISGNTNSGTGGGLYFRGGDGEGEGGFAEGFGGPPPENLSAVLAHCTVADNNTSDAGGGIGLEFGGFVVQLRNTIVAANHSAAGVDVGDLFSSGDPFVSLGHNLIGIAPPGNGLENGVNGDQVGTTASPIDPRLGPLQNNGG